MKEFLILLAVSILVISCQTPYSGDLGPKDFNGWIESSSDDLVCISNGFDQICYVTITEIVTQVVEKIVVKTETVEIEKIVEVVKERIVEVEVPVEVIVTQTIEVIKEIYVTETVSPPPSPEVSTPVVDPVSPPVVEIIDVPVKEIVDEIESTATPITETTSPVVNPPPVVETPVVETPVNPPPVVETPVVEDPATDVEDLVNDHNENPSAAEKAVNSQGLHTHRLMHTHWISDKWGNLVEKKEHTHENLEHAHTLPEGNPDTRQGAFHPSLINTLHDREHVALHNEFVEEDLTE